ncbi:MAG: lipid-binding SYLF domain-containing protein [Pseudomonadota bacterium]
MNHRRVMQSVSLLAIALLSACASNGTSNPNQPYESTLQVFRNAGESAGFFNTAYGYAVFPTIGKAGLAVGGARGTGRVYEQGAYVGEAVMTQLIAGLVAGGQAYSQIIFFEDRRALDEFRGGNFEFGAQAAAVVITAGANAGAGTTGASAAISGGRNDARTLGNSYYKGTSVFTVAKGGLMLEVGLAGQKFAFSPVGAVPATTSTGSTSTPSERTFSGDAAQEPQPVPVEQGVPLGG